MKYFHSDMAGSLLAAAAGFREGIWGHPADPDTSFFLK